MSIKIMLGIAMVLVLGVVGIQAIAHAQTYGTGTGVTGSATTGSGTISGTGSTGTGTTGTTGASGTVPGVPNTGTGGDASMNLLMLGVSGLALIGGTTYLLKRTS